MVRLFNVYYPVRTLVLMLGEALVVCASFLVAALLQYGPDSYLVLNYENGFVKILTVTAISMLCSYYFDLYEPEQLASRAETYFRLLVTLSVLCFVLSAISLIFPEVMVGKHVFVLGLFIVTFALLAWRSAYAWIVQIPVLRERVYVLGTGERAARLVQALRSRNDLGMEVIGWAGAIGNGRHEQDFAENLTVLLKRQPVHRVVVAMEDRRGKMPVNELLSLRLSGVKIDEARTLLEKISGEIEVDDLHPSAMIFAEGFRRSPVLLFARRLVSILVSAVSLVIVLPLMPLVVLAIKLDSSGPVLFRQTRVGRGGDVFTLFKFRSMWQDAEAHAGATWAGDNDPRVTRVGRFLRKTRLDEIPQLWNVLKGDMAFVGPRPERPEFVQWLAGAVPYYSMRHMIRPGLTGWAQVRYGYGASLEDSKRKLQFDLYYMKHMSVSLDLLIMFQTLKTVIFGRGAR